MSGSSWSDYFQDLGQDLIKGGSKAVLDYQIADKAKGAGYGGVEGNMFYRPTPDTVPQDRNPSGLPNGKPIRTFFMDDSGKINPLAVGAVLVVGALVVRKVM